MKSKTHVKFLSKKALSSEIRRTPVPNFFGGGGE